MSESKEYSRFKVIFHACIFVFAFGLIISSILGWNEMNRALLYLVLGLVFASESLFVLIRNLKHTSVQ